MAKRDSFLLRVDPAILASLRRWADDEMRSVNGQLEFLLRKALRDAGRLDKKTRDNPITGHSPASADDSSPPR